MANFTQKEMMVRMMDKLDKIEDKVNTTHDIASKTNGKVRLHTKLIMGIGGSIVTIVGWIGTIILK